ncbi:MAG: ABC transporter substrate-binding protein [Candidatus Bathyarchaeota archaeon]|nr:ABC transporter substrate-binding protein [Candidatus Bathyarchaeota archaeon]
MNPGKTSLILAYLAVLILPTILICVTPVSAEQVPYGPFPDRVIIFRHADEATVVPMIEKGEMDAWLFYLRLPENIRKAEESPHVDLISTYGGSIQLLVNPLETTEVFNPFHIREIREALNWLIDRSYIVSEIYHGRAAPRWTMFRSVSPDYSRIVDFAKILESRYSYNFEKAKVQIFEALSRAGAEYREGKWYYGGKPITVNFLIRPEDERKPLGDYVASQLEKLGFTVNRLYKPARDAFLLWGSFSPTKRGEWHVYTAGWAHTAITAYDDTDPWFWYSPDNAPLFEEYRGPPLLREAIDKLNNAEYKSMEERLELVKRICELALWDGVHVWVIDQVMSFPTTAKLGPSVKDLYGGAMSFWFLRTIRRVEGYGGDVKLGNRIMFIEGFNPIAGFSWLYDVYAYYLVADPGIFPHPHTGVYIPVRAEYTVTTAGPEGKLSVPADALKYDLSLGKFIPVGGGVSATSKVTFKFTLGKWHHGQPITKADILYGIAEVFKVTLKESPLYDPVAASPGRVLFTDSFRGVRFIADDTVEVYVDYWHVDNSYIASVASVWVDTPWELLVLMNEAVLEKKLAWSVDVADEWGVDQLDLTKGPSIGILKDLLDKLVRENRIPPELKDIITPDVARARWAALRSFYEARGHFWVSNGPYVFGSADPKALQMTFEAFREYPFKADRWDGMIAVKVPSVRVVRAPEDIIPGLEATFSLAVEVGGKPYDRASVKYLLLDSLGNLVAVGVAKPKGGGVFDITFTTVETGKLALGTYSLQLIAVGEEAALPSTSSYTFTVTPPIAYFERLVRATRADIEARISVVEGRISAISTDVSRLSTMLAGLQSTVNIVLALSAVAIVVAVVAIVLSLRKK